MMDEERRRRTGAFYTPPLWADKAMERVSAAVPRPGYRWDRGAMVFYDPAAGEGALLDAVVRRYGGCCLTCGTTLEEEDAETLQGKGHSQCRAADFLADGDISRIVPPVAYVAARTGRLVVVTNPPFVKLRRGQYGRMKVRYGTNDAAALFLCRILEELRPTLLYSFSKTDILQAPMLDGVRRRLGLFERIVPGSVFLTPSSSWGLKGDFPIMFAGYFGG